MLRGKSFPVAAEIVLIVAMIVGFALILQRTSLLVYQIGMGIVVASTLLEIAVGNVPKDASFWRSLRLIAIFLAITAIVFGVGILLVPYLTGLGSGAGND
jgi:hypothetical protein